MLLALEEEVGFTKRVTHTINAQVIFLHKKEFEINSGVTNFNKSKMLQKANKQKVLHSSLDSEPVFKSCLFRRLAYLMASSSERVRVS